MSFGCFGLEAHLRGVGGGDLSSIYILVYLIEVIDTLSSVLF